MQISYLNITGSGGGTGSSLAISAGRITVAQGYQVSPGAAGFMPAFNISDMAPGDTSSGYLGGQSLTVPALKTTTNTTNMVARWLLEQTSGTNVPDSVSSPANDLTLNASFLAWNSDINGKYFLPGTSRYATGATGLLPNSGDFSFECLAKNGTGTGYGFFGSYAAVSASSNITFVFEAGRTASNQWRFGVMSGSTEVSVLSTTTTVPSAIVHFIGSYNDTTKAITLYINGVLVGSGTLSGARNGNPAWQMYLGDSGGANGFDGNIYYQAMYTKVIGATEAAARYNILFPVANTAVVDIGAFGFATVNTIKITRGYANTLTEVLEYSLDGTTWTPIPIGVSPSPNGGTFAYLTTTVTLGSPLTAWRYLRYSGSDSLGTNSFRLTDVQLA